MSETHRYDGAKPRTRPKRSPEELDRLIMEMLGKSDIPLGAYEIARRSLDLGAPITPAQVYRTLDRLLARGAVQKVEALSAYLPASDERTGCIVCRCCSTVETFSMDIVAESAVRLCRQMGFSSPNPNFEILALCRKCARKAGDGHER